MKLSTEALAGLKEWLKDPPELYGRFDVLRALVDEVERSRALLKRIEWVRLNDIPISRSGVLPLIGYTCPDCGAWSYGPGEEHPGRAHTSDCELAALIAT